MIRQIIQLTNVIFKEVIRNPGIIFWTIFFPILMAWGLGLAFTKQDQLIRKVAWVKNETGVSEFEKTNSSKTIKAGNEDIGIITYQLENASKEEAIQMLKKGVVSIIIDETSGSPEYNFDAMNPEAQLSYLHITRYLDQLGGKAVPDSIVKPVETQGARYIDFLVPGLIAMNIMMSCMWGISYTLIDKRIKKLLRRMVATPMKKSAFMISQFLGRLVLGAADVIILLGFTYAYFGISIQGGIGPFFMMYFAGTVAFTGVAIFTSSRTSNAQVGNGLINIVVMPMMILSGIFFSYHSFPDWAITFIEILPLTLLANNIRGIFNEGIGISEIWPAFLLLIGVGVVFFSAGIKIYKWY